MQNIAILGAKRTPIGSFNGVLGCQTAPQLGGTAIQAAVAEARVPERRLGQVYMGVVLSAGLGQAPARQAGFHGKLRSTTPATSVNKMCGSGMSSIMLGCNAIALGQAAIVVAGGMESMTNAPHLLPDGRWGKRLGQATLLDHLLLDGLEDAYDKGVLMGKIADRCAERYRISRRQQDLFAAESYRRAVAAQECGAFVEEIAPTPVTDRQGTRTIIEDEEPQPPDIERMARLRPTFRAGGTVTPANSSKISDGAAALVLSGLSSVRNGQHVLGRIVQHSSVAAEPEQFPVVPVQAVERLLSTLSWKTADVDLWEVNEAFAVVPLIFMRETGVPHDKLNVNGGACALGHPIGASGTRIVVTLLRAMIARGARRGVAAICIGGGEATALAIERM